MYPLQQLLDPPLPPVSVILPTESLVHKKPFGSSRCLVTALGSGIEWTQLVGIKSLSPSSPP